MRRTIVMLLLCLVSMLYGEGHLAFFVFDPKGSMVAGGLIGGIFSIGVDWIISGEKVKVKKS